MRLSAIAHLGCICLTAIVFSLSVASAADDVSVAGKWTGTNSAGNWGGGSVGVEYNLVQSGQSIKGTIAVRGRPVQNFRMPRDYDTTITGKVEGRSVMLEYWTPESRKVRVTLTLTDDAQTLSGPYQLEGTLGSGEVNVSKAAN